MRPTLSLACAGLIAFTPLAAAQVELDQRFGCEADRIHTGTALNDHLGHAMVAGDWNGDGIDDLLATGLAAGGGRGARGAAPRDDGTSQAWLFLGGAENANRPPVLELVGIPALGDFPPVVAFVGDLDGDGGDELAVGAPNLPDAELGEHVGAVWILFSERDADATTPRRIDLADEALDALRLELPREVFTPGSRPHFGAALAGAGDFDGDGQLDMIVGAPGELRGPAKGQRKGTGAAGQALLFRGVARESARPSFEFWSALDAGPAKAQRGNRFGWAVRGLGDVNGDGFDDVGIGAPWASVNGLRFNSLRPGAAYVALGGAQPPSELHVLASASVERAAKAGENAKARAAVADATHTPRAFGASVAGGADFDGDGHPEVFVGCPGYAIDGEEIGAVFAYRWRDDGFVPAFDGVQPITPPRPATNAGRGQPSNAPGQFGFVIDAAPGRAGAASARLVVGALSSHNVPPRAAPCDEAQGGAQSGRAYVWGAVKGPRPEAMRPVLRGVYRGESGPEGGRMRLGTSVAAGDFDGDGRIDTAAAGSGFSTPEISESGRVYVFLSVADTR